MPDKPLVLVTGASGYIAMHCVLRLLQEGYRVRGTLRSLSKEARLRSIFAEYIDADDQLEFVVADLTSDDGWDAAMQGCEYVMHVASPVPGRAVTVDDFLRPAKEGTLRVLNAALKAEVKRVVQTSSVAAIRAGINDGAPATEDDWADPTKDISPYEQSKTLAERAVWEFHEKHPELEIAAINPVYVIGPIFDEVYSISVDIVGRILQGTYPALPDLNFAFVDARDVAHAHLLAMTHPDADGKRFICHTDNVPLRDMGKIINENFAAQGYKTSLLPMPSFIVRILARFDKGLTYIVPQLGKIYRYDNTRLKTVLGWQPRSAEQSIIDTAQSLIDKGIVTK